MLERILIGGSSGPTEDPNFKNVTLLLHGDGSNGAQNNTFTNSATGGGVSADQGIPIQGSFSPYGSNWSNSIPQGTSLETPTSSAFAITGGDFTVEGWFYWTNTSNTYPTLFSFSVDGLNDWYVYANGGTKKLSIWIDNQAMGDPPYAFFDSNITVPTNQWFHLAVVKSGANTRVYLNGVLGYTVAPDYPSGNCKVIIGTTINNPDSNRFGGMVSNFRVVKGTAVYTSAFTPPTAPLTAITNTSLLTCAYNRFRDGSVNNFTITRNSDVRVNNFSPFAPSSAYSTTTNGGSAYFDPNNLDRLNITFNYYVGNTDFTWEGWAYLTTTASPKPLFSGKIGGSNIGFDLLFENGGRALQIITSSDDVITVAAASNINLYSWNHIALSRTSGTLSVYVNGVRTYNAGFADSMANSFNLRIGGTYDYYGETWYYFPGYLSDVRYSKTGRYSGTTITVPTAPLTNDANTLGLLNFTNAGIFDNSMQNNLRTVGNAQISTSVKKFGTGSIYFDGTGDYLTIPNNDALNFGTNDFTIEMWMYAQNLASIPMFFHKGASTSTGWFFQTNTTTLYFGQLQGPYTTWSVSLSNNTWYHIALTRVGSVLNVFINGVSQGAQTVSGANASIDNTAPLLIGRFVNGSYQFQGYLDEYRITKGVARYTSNFTAPTAPFPNK